MKSVKLAELKDKLSKHLRAVEAGEEVLVTDRNLLEADRDGRSRGSTGLATRARASTP